MFLQFYLFTNTARKPELKTPPPLLQLNVQTPACEALQKSLPRRKNGACKAGKKE